MYQQHITRGQPFDALYMFCMWAFRNWAAQGNRKSAASCICFEEMLSTPHETTWRGLLQSFGLLKTSKISQHESLEQVNQECSYNILQNILHTAIESWRLILPISMMLKPKRSQFSSFHTIVSSSHRWSMESIPLLEETMGFPGPCHSPARHWACSRRDQPAWRSTSTPPGSARWGPPGIRKRSFWSFKMNGKVEMSSLSMLFIDGLPIKTLWFSYSFLLSWLVVDLALWKIWKSNGMMEFPIYWKI